MNSVLILTSYNVMENAVRFGTLNINIIKMELEIEPHDKLFISNLINGSVMVAVSDIDSRTHSWVNADHALQIINHLKEQFGI